VKARGIKGVPYGRPCPFPEGGLEDEGKRRGGAPRGAPARVMGPAVPSRWRDRSDRKTGQRVRRSAPATFGAPPPSFGTAKGSKPTIWHDSPPGCAARQRSRMVQQCGEKRGWRKMERNNHRSEVQRDCLASLAMTADSVIERQISSLQGTRSATSNLSTAGARRFKCGPDGKSQPRVLAERTQDARGSNSALAKRTQGVRRPSTVLTKRTQGRTGRYGQPGETPVATETPSPAI
jgi:hypothetical protein